MSHARRERHAYDAHRQTAGGDEAPPFARAGAETDARIFEQVRRNGAQFLRMRARAAEILRERPASSFDGFSEALDVMLPRDDDAEARIARFLAVPVPELRLVRHGIANPIRLAPRTLVRFAAAWGLTYPELVALLARDDDRFPLPGAAGSTVPAQGRHTAGEWGRAMGAVAAAWQEHHATLR